MLLGTRASISHRPGFLPLHPQPALRNSVRVRFKHHDETPQQPAAGTDKRPEADATPGEQPSPEPALGVEMPLQRNPNIPAADYVINVRVPAPQQQGGAGLSAASMPQSIMDHPYDPVELLRHQEEMQRQRLMQRVPLEQEQQAGLNQAQQLTREQRLLAEQQQQMAQANPRQKQGSFPTPQDQQLQARLAQQQQDAEAWKRLAQEAQQDAAALAAAHDQEAQHRQQLEEQAARQQHALDEAQSGSKQGGAKARDMEKALKQKQQELERARREAEDAKLDAKTLAEAHIKAHESNSQQLAEMEQQVQQQKEALAQRQRELEQAAASQQAAAKRAQHKGDAHWQSGSRQGSAAGIQESGRQSEVAGQAQQQQPVLAAEQSVPESSAGVQYSMVDSDVEVARSPTLAVGRAAGTLFSFLSIAALSGAVVGMSAPGWASEQLFHVTPAPPEAKLLIIAVASTLLPVSQALRSLMAASDHQLAGSRTVQQLCYVGIAWGVVCTLITCQAVSLHNLVLLGVWGVTCTATAGVCASVMRKSMKASEAAEQLVKGPTSRVGKAMKLVGGVLMSCVSMLAPRNAPSLLYAIMSFFFMGVGLVMAVPDAQVELLGKAAAQPHMSGAASTAAAAVIMFCSRSLTAGLYAASTLAFVLKEAADRLLLQQATPRGLNCSLGIMSCLMATVIGAACQLGIAPVNDLSVSTGLGFVLSSAVCIYNWLHQPSWHTGLHHNIGRQGVGMTGTGAYVRPVSGFGHFMRSLFGRPPYHTGVVVPPVTTGIVPDVGMMPYTGTNMMPPVMHPGYQVPGATYPVVPSSPMYHQPGVMPYGSVMPPPVQQYGGVIGVPPVQPLPQVPLMPPGTMPGTVEHAAQIVDDATFHDGMTRPGP